MSTLDRVWLFLHNAFAIFTLGPLTAAIMASPRYIRRGEIPVVRYLNRATRIYGVGTFGIVAFGLVLSGGRVAAGYLTASLTLFVVAVVLLLVIERDQRRSVHALTRTAAVTAALPGASGAMATPSPSPRPDAPPAPGDVAPLTEPARVERGRIASLSGIVGLLWLAILALMIWGG